MFNPQTMAAILGKKLPGENYIQVLESIHRILRPKRYLEIGTAQGNSLALALPGTFAIGVDPITCITTPLSAWCKIIRATSNSFFANYGEEPFDLIFIDGLHVFEAVVEDFCNSEKHCSPNTVILLHDTIPASVETSTKIATNFFWTGDVWKIVPAIIKGRPDLQVFTIPCIPSGLTVIKGFTTPKGIPQEIIKEFENKEFSWVDPQWRQALNVVTNDPAVWIPKLIKS